MIPRVRLELQDTPPALGERHRRRTPPGTDIDHRSIEVEQSGQARQKINLPQPETPHRSAHLAEYRGRDESDDATYEQGSEGGARWNRGHGAGVAQRE